MNNLAIYNTVKGEMKTGDLLQWRSNSMIGALIRWRTKSEVNHSSLVLRFLEYEDSEGRRFTTEALEHGTVLNLLSRRLAEFDGSVWWYPLQDKFTDIYRGSVAVRALDMIGLPYDYESIFKQIVGKVSADSRSLFCSEYCYLSYGFRGEAPTPADMPGMGIFKEPVKIL